MLNYHPSFLYNKNLQKCHIINGAISAIRDLWVLFFSAATRHTISANIINKEVKHQLEYDLTIGWNFVCWLWWGQTIDRTQLTIYFIRLKYKYKTKMRASDLHLVRFKWLPVVILKQYQRVMNNWRMSNNNCNNSGPA